MLNLEYYFFFLQTGIGHMLLILALRLCWPNMKTVNLTSYILWGVKKQNQNNVLLIRTIASNSSDQMTPINKYTWKNRVNLKITIRSLFLAVSCGLWRRAFPSKNTISFEILSRTFQKFFRQMSSNKVSQCQ